MVDPSLTPLNARQAIFLRAMKWHGGTACGVPPYEGVIDSRKGAGVFFSHQTIPAKGRSMGTAVKKTISLPLDLAREVEEIARAEGKSLSAVVQDALRLARATRRKEEFRDLQGFWSHKAKERGILTEDDLQRYLAE